MAIAPTTRYFVVNALGDNKDFLDFGLSYGGGAISTVGEVIQYNGSANVDGIFVRPGMTVDATSTGDGSDNIYLSGSLLDYSLTTNLMEQTLTLSRTVDGMLESVTISAGTSLVYDNLVFANGQVSGNALYKAVNNNTALPVPDPATNSLTSPPLPTQGATVKAYAISQSGDTFATVKPGVNLDISGGGGVDKVYVTDGTNVDATDTGGANDFIYMRGNWADYTKAIDTIGKTITFTRSVGGFNEVVKVSGGSSGSHDTVVFADGAAQTNDAFTALKVSLSAGTAAIGGAHFNPAVTTPLYSDAEVAKALAKIAAAADANTATATNPTLQDYITAGVTGVTDGITGNLAAINSALDSTPINAGKADTTAEVQAIVNGYSAILASADGTASNTTTALTATQYTDIGVTGVSTGSALHLLDDVVDGKAQGAVDTVQEVQALADAANAVQAQAAGTAGLTMAQLNLLGVTGLSAGIMSGVSAAIAATDDSGNAVDTLAKIQTLVNGVNHAPTVDNPSVGSGAVGLFAKSSVAGTVIGGPAMELTSVSTPDGAGGFYDVPTVVGWTYSNPNYSLKDIHVLNDYTTTHTGEPALTLNNQPFGEQNYAKWRDNIDGGTSQNGGAFIELGNLLSGIGSAPIGISTNLTGLVVGKTYVYGMQWQQMRTMHIDENGSNYYFAGGQLVMSVGGQSQVFTSSGLADGWNTALYSFTATSSTATLQVSINGLTGINQIPYPVKYGWDGSGGDIAIDSLNAAQVMAANPVVQGAGATTNVLFGSVSDTDTSASLKGWAITSAAADGAGHHWQYSSDQGASWHDMDGASTGQAIYLATTDLIHWTGLKGTNTELNARAVDNTGPALHASNALAGSVDTTQNGGSTAYSSNTAVLAANAPPLLLDLNHDGQIEYSQIAMDMDGKQVNTAWVGASDGMLFWDKYADGSLHGSEQYVFGKNTGSDLSGLRIAFDSNSDFQFNTSDAQFSQFGVWQDANQNGMVDADEYHTLSQLGITSLSLSSNDASSSPAKGVSVLGESTAALADGSSMLLVDAIFEYTNYAVI